MPSVPALIHLSPAAPLAPLDWLALLHPVLAILFLYPVVGATIRLAILVRERRLDINPIAATVPVEHADHGRWVGSGMVVLVLLAVIWSVLANPLQPAAAAGGLGRLLPLLPMAGLALAGCLALWRLRSAPLRLTKFDGCSQITITPGAPSARSDRPSQSQTVTLPAHSP